LTFRNFRLDSNIIGRVARIGTPAMVSAMQRTMSQLFLLRFVAEFGTIAVAAHSVANRVEMVLFMPGMAFGTAAGVLVGQNLGAGQPERAEKSAWLAAAVVEAILITCSVAILIWPGGIIRIFNAEAPLVAMASVFLRIGVAGYVVLGVTAVAMMALNGAGDTFWPMVFSVVGVWAVTLPLAFFLPKVGNLGVYGVRWAVVAGMVVSAIAFLAYFRTGRWKRKQV